MLLLVRIFLIGACLCKRFQLLIMILINNKVDVGFRNRFIIY
nr:MAG TPA: hypothetical protein [Caudoviricetes sp.]